MFLLLSLTNLPWADKLSYSSAPRYVIGGLTCAIILISVLGNLMVLFAVARNKILQRMNVAWYVSLAIADLGKATICMPIFVALLLTPNWSLSKDMCPVYHCFQMSFELVSILNLTAISLDRVFMITRPLTYQRTVNFTKILVCIITLWIVSILFSFLQLLWWEDGSEDSSQWKYYLLEQLGLTKLDCAYKPPLVMAIVDFGIMFVVPMIIMAVSYTKIFLVVHSQMRRLKRRVSDVNEDASDPDPDQYSQIPAITKSVDALRANTSEERLKYSSGPMPSRSSFAIAQSELARITEMPHENCSSPLNCKECSSRSRTGTDDSAKSNPNTQTPRQLKREDSDLSVVDLTEETVQVENSPGSMNSNNNAKSKNTASKANKPTEPEDIRATRSIPQDRLPSVESQPAMVERRSSLKKAQRDSIVSTKRVSVQFQLYPEEQETEIQEQPEPEIQERTQQEATKSRKTRSTVVLEDDTTTSEAVTTSTWLSGSSGGRSRVVRQPCEEHMQAWASRHFSGTQDMSFSSGTRASIAESTGSWQTWNNMLQRRRKSLQRIRENKAVRMTFVVIGAFVFCWLPFEVLFLIKQFCEECVNDTTWLAATMIAYSASAINPFIYNFYSREFRRALKRALCCDDNVVAPWM